MVMKILLSVVLLYVSFYCEARQQFIIGGSEADIEDFPFVGSYKNVDNLHVCGCVLVAGDWALSAGHCAGSSLYTTEWGSSELGQGKIIHPKTIVTHPNFGEGPGAFPNDILVMELESSVTTGTPIAMARDRTDYGTGDMAGWGRTCISCDFPNTLHAVNINIITDGSCTEQWGDYYNRDIHVCVWDSVNHEAGPCHGDSGGPLVSTGQLVGIHSWSPAECNNTKPSGFSRISHFRSWVCDETSDAAEGCLL